MTKPVINYINKPQYDRVNNRTIFVPTIVDREAPISLEGVIESAIDRGLVVGVKANAARAIAEGIAEELYHQFCLGRGIQFGQYFNGRLYLDGSSPSSDAMIGPGNGVNIRLVKGTLFKLRTEDFSWHLVGSENFPRVDFVLANDEGAVRGEIRRHSSIAINGDNLAEATCTLSWKFGEEVRTAAATISARGANLLVIDCPAEFSGIADGTEVTFTVAKTADGKEYAVNATAVVAG